MTDFQILKEIKKGYLFCYHQCNIEVPEIARANLTNFPPINKNTLVSKIGIEDLWKIEHHITKRNSDYSSAVVLSAVGPFS